MKCSFCELEIKPGAPAICVVGGLFPVDEPDFFMIDESVLPEGHAHRECFRSIVELWVNRAAPSGDKPPD